MQWQVRDTGERYGAISRLLHWGMALLLVWQFASALAHLLLDDTPLEAFLWGTHKSVGFLLMMLILLRAAWALHSRASRPAAVNAGARYGHLALYALMLGVPLLALLRQYGSGRSFAPFGVPVMPGFDGPEIAWMELPGDLLHSWLGWTLLVLIVGHIAIVIVHRRGRPEADVLPRMVGTRHR